MLSDLHVAILDGLPNDPVEVDPHFGERRDGTVIAIDWCEGFMEAVSLRPESWLPLRDNSGNSFLLTPIMTHILYEEGQSVLGISASDLHAVLDEAGEVVSKSIIAEFNTERVPDTVNRDCNRQHGHKKSSTSNILIERMPLQKPSDTTSKYDENRKNRTIFVATLPSTESDTPS